MKTLLPVFDYLRPATLEEALEILEKHRDAAEVLAGGTDLLVKLKDKTYYEKKIILDINSLKELDYVRKRGDELAVGALTRVETLMKSGVVRDYVPLLADVAYEFGTWQIRNMATVGGNLANASNANDFGVALMALDAKLVLKSKGGERIVSLEKFFLSNHKADIQPGELLVEAFFPLPKPDAGTAFLKMEGRESSSYPIINTAVYLRLNTNKVVEDVRIAVGGVAPTPVRLRPLEEKLRGLNLGEWSKIDDVLRLVKKMVQPSSSTVASKKYRTEMSYVFVKRALMAAAARTQFLSRQYIS